MEPHWMWRHRRLREGLPDDLFRFGVQFADGRKATNLNSPFGGLDPDEVPDDGPRRGRWRELGTGLLVVATSAPGELSFFCEWPAHGIAETRVAIDGTPIIAAADQAVVLWDAPSRGGGGAYAYRALRSHQRGQAPDAPQDGS